MAGRRWYLGVLLIGVGVLSQQWGVGDNTAGSPRRRPGATSTSSAPNRSRARTELPTANPVFITSDDLSAATPNTPTPNSFTTCPIVNSPLRFAKTGQRCVFPYRDNNIWREGIVDGRCATEVGSDGEVLTYADAEENQVVTADMVCTAVHSGVACPHTPAVQNATCETDIGKGRCVCSGGGGSVEFVVRSGDGGDGGIPCRVTTCEKVCRGAVEDVMSTGHSFSRDTAGVSLLQYIAHKAQRHAPRAKKKDINKWHRFAAELPGHEKVRRLWCGRGIAIMAGRKSTLPQAIATAAFLRGYLKSNLPVEIWQHASEVTEMGESFQRGLQQLSIVLRTLPPEANSRSSGEMFSLKPAVVLASTFDEVMFFDSDALPLVDPKVIFDERTSNLTAVFWPDYWTLYWDATIWSTMGGWPFEGKHAPSQESGLMVICKSCGAWRALALSFFFNYHASTFYPAIYTGHYDEKWCGRSTCTRGGRNYHIMPGMGDKDTFQIAHMALNVSFKMMASSALGGPLLSKRGLVCGTTIIHRGTDKSMIALHHNSNKWSWHDFASGLWDATPVFPTHASIFRNESDAFHSDGQNEWDSITYSWREDAGRQPTPPGTRWCIVYKGSTFVSQISDTLGFSIEKVLGSYYVNLYSTPWLIEWIDSMDTVPKLGWEADLLFALFAGVLVVYLFVAKLLNVDGKQREPSATTPRGGYVRSSSAAKNGSVAALKV